MSINFCTQFLHISNIMQHGISPTHLFEFEMPDPLCHHHPPVLSTPLHTLLLSRHSKDVNGLADVHGLVNHVKVQGTPSMFHHPMLSTPLQTLLLSRHSNVGCQWASKCTWSSQPCKVQGTPSMFPSLGNDHASYEHQFVNIHGACQHVDTLISDGGCFSNGKLSSTYE